MIVSTRGRYALRLMIDIAENSGGAYIPMKEIASRQKLSLKYLERIVPTLTQNGLLEGVQGKGGGYRLCRRPEEYKIGEILRLTEGDLAPVSCLECESTGCEMAESCRTRPMWVELNKMIGDFFDGITLQDLMQGDTSSL